MKNCLKIAVTGGIGSGKSQVLAYLKEKAYPVFSCDEINAELWQDDKYLKKLQEFFPDCVQDGKIDKDRLKEMVFSSKESRRILEKISHPLILEKLFSYMDGQKTVSFAEVPLLFEAGLEDKFDKVIVVMRDLQDRKRAIILRDDCDETLADLKIKSQFSYEKAYREGYFSNEKFYLIFNDGSLDDLRKKIDFFLQQIN